MYNQYDDHVESHERSVRALLYQVFGWLAFAVGVSGVTAYLASGIPALQTLPVVLIMFAIQLGIIFALGRSLATLSTTTVQALYIAYAITTGLMLSGIFTVYALGSVAQIFFASSAMFAGMALYGFYTERDLARYSSLLYMTLWGIIVTMFINFFIGSRGFDLIISIVGVLVFSALIAVNIQQIRILAAHLIERNETWYKSAMICALQLYLGFINLFLMMLRLFGRRD